MSATAVPNTSADLPNLRRDVVAGYRNAPDHMVAEVLDGELYLMPRPRPRHGLAAGVLLTQIQGPFQLSRGGPGGWTLLPEPELHLGRRPDIVDPDIAGWRAERLPADVFADDAPGAITIAPDWICEILSERTEAIDRGKKRRIYRREEVGHLWLLDPRDRLLEVYRLDHGRWTEVADYEGAAVVRAEPFDAIELDLAVLWGTRIVSR